MSNLFDLNELIPLIDDAIKPYTIDARHGNPSVSTALPYFPTENIEEKIHDHLGRFLANHSTWPLETFLAFACGLLHREIFTELGEMLIPSDTGKPTEFEVI